MEAKEIILAINRMLEAGGAPLLDEATPLASIAAELNALLDEIAEVAQDDELAGGDAIENGAAQVAASIAQRYGRGRGASIARRPADRTDAQVKAALRSRGIDPKKHFPRIQPRMSR